MNELDYLFMQNWTIIPLLPKSKKPTSTGWQTRTAADNDPSEFDPASNVGVVLGDASGGVVDIDCDTEVARLAASHLLPPTGAIFGRASSPRSHFIFRVPDAGKKVAHKVRGVTSVEYRANGCMTVFPPSVHKDTGEWIEWDPSADREIGAATREDLLTAIALIAAVDLIHPFYQVNLRHDLTLHLSGTLSKWGWSPDSIIKFVEVLCDVMNDEESEDRLLAASNTAERAMRGESITGEAELAEIIGNDELKALRELFGVSKPKKANPNRVPVVSPVKSDLVLGELDKNDAGVAKLFADKIRDRVAFVSGPDIFYYYDGSVWQPDPKKAAVSAMFTEFILRRCNKIGSSGLDPSIIQSQLKALVKYRNAGPAASALDQARYRLQVPFGKFDSNDDLLAVGNGVINLRTGELQEASFRNYLTKRIEINYDPTAKCPLFQQFVKQVCCNDRGLIDYLQALIGYWATGHTNQQEFYILHGQGANGKSVLIDTISRVLKPYSGTLMPETLFEGGNNTAADLSTMVGKRLAVASEAESQHRLNGAAIKRFTGDETIKVRALYQNGSEMRNQMKIVIACNKTPEFDGNDNALKRRVKVIPFNLIVPSGQRDHTLKEKLWAEREGILAYIVEGAWLYYMGEARVLPSAVIQATDDYFGEFDSLGAFLDAKIESDGTSKVPISEVFGCYEDFCDQDGRKPCDRRDFGIAMRNRGFQKVRGTGGVWCYKGVKIIGDEIAAAISPTGGSSFPLE